MRKISDSVDGVELNGENRIERFPFDLAITQTDARSRDQNIESVEISNDCFQRLVVSDVYLTKVQLDPVADSGSVGAQANRYDVSTVTREILCRRLTDSRRASSNKGSFSSEKVRDKG